MKKAKPCILFAFILLSTLCLSAACGSAPKIENVEAKNATSKPVNIEPVNSNTNKEADTSATLENTISKPVNPKPVNSNTKIVQQKTIKTVNFKWCPSSKVANAYEMSDIADQHKIIFTKGVTQGGSFPVIVAFHGQPKRGTPPRDYAFLETVENLITSMVENREIEPVILVLPVFRFVGGNWPYFNTKKFREKVEELLVEQNVKGTNWYEFGHSGAAGCGGGGLNEAHRMNPKAVGFFDTCLGSSWAKEIEILKIKKIKTVNIHSVETAGFRPRQKPEYQSNFKFSRAYEPTGLNAVKCPSVTPGSKLRQQKGKCSATNDRTIWGFIIDTGKGKEAHRAILEPSIRYFLSVFSDLKITN